MSSSCIKWRSKVVDQFHLYSKIREKRKMGSVQRTISGTSRCVPTKCRAKNERSHEVLLICGFHFSPDPGCFGLFFVSFFLLFSFSVLAALLKKRRNFIGKSAKRGSDGNFFYDFIIASSANTKGFELHRSPKITTQPRFYRNHPLNEFMYNLHLSLFFILFIAYFGCFSDVCLAPWHSEKGVEHTRLC